MLASTVFLAAAALLPQLAAAADYRLDIYTRKETAAQVSPLPS